jgi:hypothetical protein
VSGLDPQRWSGGRSAERPPGRSRPAGTGLRRSGASDFRLLHLIATVIDACGRQPDQRLDAAPPPGGLGRDGRAGEGARPAGRYAARPPRPDPRCVLRPRQARRRPHRSEPDRPGQARHEVPRRGGRRGRAGGLRRHRRQRQRHARLRAPVPRGVRGHGQDPHRVRGQGVRCRTPSGPVPQLRRNAPDPQARSASRIRAWEAALARRAQHCLGTGEQASRAALRPARLRHPVAAPGRLHIPRCRAARPEVQKTGSKGPTAWPPASTT